MIATSVQFKRRAVRSESDCGSRREWWSRCGRYVVRESSPVGMPTVYYAMHVDWLGCLVGVERGQSNAVKRHRKRTAAMKACRKHAAKQRGRN